MNAIKVFRHRDYELQCSANATDGGTFAPALVVAKQVWPSRPRVIATERGHHLTEDTAIAAAYSTGLEWIRNYG
jgi:hypothetical protein